jgi:para-aminobenzoate synthetase/4-amino-4-deoxychorismate lyase
MIKKELERAVNNENRGLKIRLILDMDAKARVEKTPVERVDLPVKIKLSKRKTHSKDIFFYHKTTKRRLYDSERRKAQEEGFFEVIFMNERNELTEGSITNLFILKDRYLYTPALSSGLLPGVLREYLIKKDGVREEKLYLKDLLEAKKVYVGNSIRGLLEADVEQVKYSGIISKI